MLPVFPQEVRRSNRDSLSRGLFFALWHFLRKTQKQLSVALAHFGEQLAEHSAQSNVRFVRVTCLSLYVWSLASFLR
jgi:hypothetical protein